LILAEAVTISGRALPPARPQQHRRDAEMPGMPPMQYDGITELWFDDVESLARCFSDWKYFSICTPAASWSLRRTQSSHDAGTPQRAEAAKPKAA